MALGDISGIGLIMGGLQMKTFYEKELQIAGKTVTIYSGAACRAPIVYINAVSKEHRQVWDACIRSGCPDFTLAAVSGLNWNQELSPWEQPSVFRGQPPFTGGADAYLTLLEEHIVPAVSRTLCREPLYTAIAGYSLAGLFALYALYRTGIFARAASVSASLWFPGFTEYAFQHSFCRKPDCVYFSLGNKESKTRSIPLKTVEERTKQLEHFYREQGIATTYVENEGNHFQDADKRMAAGIRWLLKTHEEKP